MRAPALAAVLLVGTIVGACGGDDDDDTAELDAGLDAETDAAADAEPPPPGDSELVREDLGSITVPAGDEGAVEPTVPDGALSLLVVASGAGDATLYLDYIVDPSQATLYDWLVGSDSVRPDIELEQLTVLVPDAPEEGISTGSYLFGFSSDSPVDLEVRVTAIAKVGAERDHVVLDVVHHFVGLDGIIDAASAPEDPDFAVVLATYARTLARAGIVVGTVVFEDVDDPELSSIDSYLALDSELSRLFALAPDGRALHLFWVEQLSDPDEAYPLNGRAGGIPGPATIGGTHQSGVVIEGVDLHATPATLGLVAVHESLHYLGLFHTSERCVEGPSCLGPLHDPIADTAACEDELDEDGNGILTANECLHSDAANIMFWTIGADVPEITEDQSWVARRSPLPR